MEKDIWDETNFYGVVDDLENRYTDEEMEEIKAQFFAQYGDILRCTFFADDNFFRNFINKIPAEKQEEYITNTINYMRDKEYDPNYVIVARRAVPSYESKPENFWTTDANEALRGLRNEIQKEQRLHSVIMVSTLKKLIDHGIVETERGGSDGEIAIDPNKNFDEFLFMYKPRHEFWELVDYLENGGISREQLLEQLRANATERAIRQGLPIKLENKTQIQTDEIEEYTFGVTISGINGETQYLKDIIKEENIKDNEGGLWQDDDEW